jgi:hypothetical protein
MVTLQMEHAITDYDTWKQAFDRFAEKRTAAGVRSHRVAKDADDENYLVIELDFDRREQAEAFRTFLVEQVWAIPANAPALNGSPTTRILVTA